MDSMILLCGDPLLSDKGLPERFDEMNEAMRISAAVVTFDMEGKNLGQINSISDLITMQYFGNLEVSEGGLEAVRMISTKSAQYTVLLDIESNAEARKFLGQWLKNKLSYWVGWGILGDLAALAKEYNPGSSDDHPNFVDLQVPASLEVYKALPQESETLMDTLYLKGLEKYLTDEESLEKKRFKRSIAIRVISEEKHVSYVERPLTRDSLSIQYALQDIKLIALAAKKILLDLESSGFEKTKTWTDVIVKKCYVSVNSPSQGSTLHGCNLLSYRQISHAKNVANAIRKDNPSKYLKEVEKHYKFLENKKKGDGGDWLLRSYRTCLDILEYFEHSLTHPLLRGITTEKIIKYKNAIRKVAKECLDDFPSVVGGT